MKIHPKLSALLSLLAHPDALHYNADGSETKDLNEVYEDWVGAGKPVVEESDKGADQGGWCGGR
jgi:hypothetical protein